MIPWRLYPLAPPRIATFRLQRGVSSAEDSPLPPDGIRFLGEPGELSLPRPLIRCPLLSAVLVGVADGPLHQVLRLLETATAALPHALDGLDLVLVQRVVHEAVEDLGLDVLARTLEQTERVGRVGLARVEVVVHHRLADVEAALAARHESRDVFHGELARPEGAERRLELGDDAVLGLDLARELGPGVRLAPLRRVLGILGRPASVGVVAGPLERAVQLAPEALAGLALRRQLQGQALRRQRDDEEVAHEGVVDLVQRVDGRVGLLQLVLGQLRLARRAVDGVVDGRRVPLVGHRDLERVVAVRETLAAVVVLLAHDGLMNPLRAFLTPLPHSFSPTSLQKEALLSAPCALHEAAVLGRCCQSVGAGQARLPTVFPRQGFTQQQGFFPKRRSGGLCRPLVSRQGLEPQSFVIHLRLLGNRFASQRALSLPSTRRSLDDCSAIELPGMMRRRKPWRRVRLVSIRCNLGHFTRHYAALVPQQGASVVVFYCVRPRSARLTA